MMKCNQLGFLFYYDLSLRLCEQNITVNEKWDCVGVILSHVIHGHFVCASNFENIVIILRSVLS